MRKRIKSLTDKIFMEIMHSQNPVITVGHHAKTVNDINSVTIAGLQVKMTVWKYLYKTQFMQYQNPLSPQM